MEAVSPFPDRSSEAGADLDHAARRERAQTMTVTATYRLSEEGRKASILAGGDGRAVQAITLDVPTNRMHLVHVDEEGRARLKLHPRYTLNANQQVVRDDAPPIFDALPSVEDLLKEAGRNHQLERAYRIERAEARRKRQDGKFDLHQQIADEFLADPTRRAHEHPRPTPRQCYLTARDRVVLFDAKTDLGVARQVAPEAYRRYCADVKARTERNREISRRELALRDERARAIAEWVQTRGTRDQQDRHAAGMLPMREVLEAMADAAFVAASNRPRYVHDGVQRLQAHLQRFPQYTNVIVTPRDLRVTTEHAEDATEAQWTLMQELRALFPDGDVVLQRHHLAWAPDHNAPSLTMWGVLVKRRVGPFLLLREYLAPTPAEPESVVASAKFTDVFDRERL